MQRSNSPLRSSAALKNTKTLRLMSPQFRTLRTGGKLATRQVEKLRKAVEKAEKARFRIEQRTREWDKLYAAKPSKDEDPEDIRAIQLAKENLSDLKLKTAKDFIVPEHKRMTVEKKTAQLDELEEQSSKPSQTVSQTLRRVHLRDLGLMKSSSGSHKGRAASRSRLSSSRRSLNPDKAASSGRARDPTRRPLELCDEDIA
ncbi:hypothetical protein KOW79_018632 [Hemibagrus wyckioides]|uniref:Uncharacterized protein n=1 Tax=Hemibagrus wyckioides TaxID=337641 RepID=A0A9D3NAY4_9TELE|nr:hypothetical protein KOW79_018632 [Hemibagrus wyckioides]